MTSLVKDLRAVAAKHRIKYMDVVNIQSELGDGDVLLSMVNLRTYGVRVIWNDNGNDRTHVFE